MTKDEALELLGGSVVKAAEAIGINSQAISQWPDDLPPRLSDRVQAALYRQQLAAMPVQKTRAKAQAVQVCHG